jgi:hypothetical protein
MENLKISFLTIYEKDHTGITYIARAVDRSWTVKKGSDLVIFVNVEGDILRSFSPYVINEINGLRDFVENEVTEGGNK